MRKRSRPADVTGAGVFAFKALAIARRKAIYEEMHPETMAGVAGGLARQGSATDNLSFAEATAESTGKAERTIRLAAARGKALRDDLDDIAGTSLDNKSDLDAMAKMKPEERKPLIERAKAGERVSARKEPKIAADPLTDELAAERQVARLMEAWNAAGPDARAEFLLRIGDRESGSLGLCIYAILAWPFRFCLLS
ncbi:MAG: hypothetical protein EKK29_05995 [Hyphomicrobiales bacterium]|nr:MAG: hypothetical protein EKK29_05995 [Hyphomicrobiales bacterium]